MTGLHAGAEPPPPPRCYAITSPGPAASLRHAEIPLGGWWREGQGQPHAVCTLWRSFGHQPEGGEGEQRGCEGRHTHRRRRRQNTHGEKEGGEKREGAGRQAHKRHPALTSGHPALQPGSGVHPTAPWGLSLCITYGHTPVLLSARRGHLGPDPQFAVRFRVDFLLNGLLLR